MAHESQRKAPALPEEILRKMLKAQEKEDFDDFVSMGTVGFREKLKKSIFFRACEALSASLATGYELEFVLELEQRRRALYVWKLTFSNGLGQALVRCWISPEGKVSGILLDTPKSLYPPDLQAEAV